MNNAPFTLMLNSLSKCSSTTLPKGTNSPTPALAKIVSIRAFTSPTALVETIQVGQFGDVSMPHAHWYSFHLPESREALEAQASFLDRHLG